MKKLSTQLNYRFYIDRQSENVVLKYCQGEIKIYYVGISEQFICTYTKLVILRPASITPVTSVSSLAGFHKFCRNYIFIVGNTNRYVIETGC